MKGPFSIFVMKDAVIAANCESDVRGIYAFWSGGSGLVLERSN